jgi:hypothetical protein
MNQKRAPAGNTTASAMNERTNRVFGSKNLAARNNGHQNFSSLGAAIDAVTRLIGSDPKYTSYNSSQNIYSKYEEGNVNAAAPMQGVPDQIYGTQLSGNLSNVRNPRCP